MSEKKKKGYRAVLRLPTEELRSKALKAAAQRGYTVQQTEAMVERVLSARPKPKRKLMVKDVRIFVNTIEHALKVMTGSGIPATATRNESDEYIEYVVRIPTRPPACPPVQEKEDSAEGDRDEIKKNGPSSGTARKEPRPAAQGEAAPPSQAGPEPPQVQYTQAKEVPLLPEPEERAPASQAEE